MCGILGYSHIAKCLPAGVLTSALKALVHRGPDHQGTFCSEQISMGATRLRILDLEGGDQPLFSPDRNVVIVFNGEIFNYYELRAQLEADGQVDFYLLTTVPLPRNNRRKRTSVCKS